MIDTRPLDLFPNWSLRRVNGPAGTPVRYECAVQPERGQPMHRETRLTKRGAIEAAVKWAWRERRRLDELAGLSPARPRHAPA